VNLPIRLHREQAGTKDKKAVAKLMTGNGRISSKREIGDESEIAGNGQRNLTGL
jgi:hypothetical protein